MKRNNNKFALALIGCLMLAACSDKPEPEVKSEVTVAADEGKTKPVAADEQIPKAARTIEEMIAQPAGKLVEAHMDPEIEAARTVNWVYYHRFYEDTFKGIMEKELPTYLEEHPDLSADEIYDYLVYQLGSGQYSTFYDPLTAYAHGYVMPELPEGEDEIEIAKRQQTNVVILMDASGSMKAEIGGESRMSLAKQAIEEFTSQLPEDVNVSLFAYGHKGAGTEADKQLSCSSIDELYPLGAYNADSFATAMDSFQASGWTPLAGAMEKAHEYLSSYDKEQYRNIVYIVSDGVETCDGNPVAAAKQLHDSEIEAKVNIIGFDVDDEGQNQLKTVAEAGGGEYATVRNPSEFEGVIIKKWKPSMMQVMSQQGVKLHELVHQKEALIAIHDPLSNLSEREKTRITNAVAELKKKKLIDDEKANEVTEIAKEMGELRSAHFSEIKEQKSEEATKAKDEIDAKVEAWKEKWSSELEKDEK
ncbi:VWA domain-containing protein [Sporosarcina luteola]|uniref:vWA domain-containing protein n=1 Tax=Sporosarcina luteola TaxID=582850 RepID=UPI0020423EE7|nr:VWA domain-containing protein [Sporosarcina luteola]MCM3638875.1 VWA domain-containing protein [Sporosarcina luteola]